MSFGGAKTSNPREVLLGPGRGATQLVWRRRLGLVLLALVLVLAAAVRFHRLGSQSFWLDEAYTYSRAAMTPAETIHASIKKGHVPTYFVVMHYWMAALGDSEATLRTPSAIFGVLTVAAAMLLGWIVGGFRPAFATGLLVALSPLQVGYSQEARMYTMFTFTATLAMCGLAWLLADPDRAQHPLWRRETWQARAYPPAAGPAGRATWLHIPASPWLVYVAATVATLYLHNTGVFLVATCSLCILVLMAFSPNGRWTVLKNWVFAHLAVLVLWSFWIRDLLRQTHRLLKHFWPDFPNAATMWTILSRLYLFDMQAFVWLGILLLGLSGWGLWSLRKRPQLALGLLILALAPPLLVLLVSLRTPMFLPRIMLWSAVPFFVLASAGLFAVRIRALSWVALAGVIAGGFLSLDQYFHRYGRKTPWREVAQLLSDEYDSDAMVFATSGQERTALAYYYKRLHEPLQSVPIVTVAPWEMQDYLHDARVVWLLDGKLGSRAETKYFREEIERHGHLVSERRFRNVNLFKYSLEAEQEQPAQRQDVRDDDAGDTYLEADANEG